MRVRGGVQKKSAFILASSSSRREALLASIGVFPTHIIGADIDETPLKNEKALSTARRLAQAKAEKIAMAFPDLPVLGADTVAILSRRMLGKPKDEEEARRFLSLLSGRRHHIVTAICLVLPSGRCIARDDRTLVGFKRLEQSEIEGFIATEEWKGKSGGYAIQGYGGGFVRVIRGSPSNVAGLPLFETRQILRSVQLTPF